jgi:hypothetical protein
MLAALVLLVAPGGGHAGSRVHLQIEVPGENALVGDPDGMAFIAGQALAGPADLERFDLGFVIDTSRSTDAPSGADVDGDGRVGRRGPKIVPAFLGSFLPFRNSDPDDSVLAAEVAAVRTLLEQLDPRSTRVGVVGFAGDAVRESVDAWTAVPLTSDYERVHAGLDAILAAGPRGETHMAAGLRRGVVELLGTSSASSQRREARRILIFVTDGTPTLPFPGQSKWRNAAAAIREARLAARAGVRIDTYAVGRRAVSRPVAAVGIARAAGGRFTAVRDPGDLPRILERARFTEIETLEIQNRTTGEHAAHVIRGVDGSFAALVPMREGQNRVRVVARSSDGGAGSRTVTLRFLPEAAMPELPAGLVDRRNRLLESRLSELREARQQAGATLRRRLEVEAEQVRSTGPGGEHGREIRITTQEE